MLHYACLHNLGALVPVLLARGANPNLRTGDGQYQVNRDEADWRKRLEHAAGWTAFRWRFHIVNNIV